MHIMKLIGCSIVKLIIKKKEKKKNPGRKNKKNYKGWKTSKSE